MQFFSPLEDFVFVAILAMMENHLKQMKIVDSLRSVITGLDRTCNNIASSFFFWLLGIAINHFPEKIYESTTAIECFKETCFIKIPSYVNGKFS